MRVLRDATTSAVELSALCQLALRSTLQGWARALPRALEKGTGWRLGLQTSIYLIFFSNKFQ
jgi:hypothetical protein